MSPATVLAVLQSVTFAEYNTYKRARQKLSPALDCWILPQYPTCVDAQLLQLLYELKLFHLVFVMLKGDLAASRSIAGCQHNGQLQYLFIYRLMSGVQLRWIQACILSKGELTVPPVPQP